jgi:hypothetical protein
MKDIFRNPFERKNELSTRLDPRVLKYALIEVNIRLATVGGIFL